MSNVKLTAKDILFQLWNKYNKEHEAHIIIDSEFVENVIIPAMEKYKNL